ncbi:rhomboid family intramembrane serine protease [Mycobacterium sp. SMC-4]|uniref:rhomboid family intramembrane serine protease n=1 Tax=Mycobacterium sp. SMC-4 TaxID=2857059 RepID=UPI003D043EEC
MSHPYQPGAQPPTPTCYRHPDRPTWVRCTRCGRFICPECMRNAAVGHQCPDCVSAAARTAPVIQTPAGGRRPTSALGAAPILTYALIAVNVLMFILQSTSAALERDLVLWAPAVADGDLYRLLTSAFLHYGLVHLLFNMFALYIVGPPLEMALGRLRFGALYLLSALGGSVLVYLLSSLNSATAGASGAIFGLFGATFVVGRKLNADVRGVIGIIVLNLVITFVIPLVSSQNISWQGHLGGLVSGAAVAAAYMYAPARQRNAVQAAATAAAVILFATLVWWRTAELRALFGLG